MDTTFIPTPQDDKLIMEAAVTKTVTGTGTVLDLGIGFAPGGVGQPNVAVTQITAVDFTTGDESYKLQVMESSDNASFTQAGPIITLAPAVGVVAIPAFISKRYVRLDYTLGGTTPSITYNAWLNPNCGLA